VVETDTILNTDTTYRLAILDTGVTFYTDRAFKITSVPDSFKHMQMIKTANGDKRNTSDSYLSFTLSQQSTVYVAFDPRARVLPYWLTGWQKLTDSIGLNAPALKSFSLYSKVYPAGTVILGGASAFGAINVLNQYFVIAKAVPNPAPGVPVSNSPFVLGVNGHFGVDPYLYVTATDQIGFLQKMGMTYYRHDIIFHPDGTISYFDKFKKLYDAATASGITMLPAVCSTNFDINASESDSYAAGNTLGINIATQNSAYFNYYELGNELDNDAIISGDGSKAYNYDANKLRTVAAYLKGMDDGIKSVQPTAKTLIDASWLHYYFVQYMIAYGNKFDIVAWHWYSDMESAAARAGIADISIMLTRLFNKPIWFTECAQRPNKVFDPVQPQLDFMTYFITKVKQNPNVGAVIYYELFDEPQKSAAENSYGIVKWTVPYTEYLMTPVAQHLSSNTYR
jgi:hypothetical protein